MDVCKGCAFEFGWTQQSTSVPNECKGCQMVDGKPSSYKPKPQTNADRIRAMSDETLAIQLVQVVKETIRALTDLDVPYEILNEVRSQVLEKLKQPADMRGEEE